VDLKPTPRALKRAISRSRDAPYDLIASGPVNGEHVADAFSAVEKSDQRVLLLGIHPKGWYTAIASRHLAVVLHPMVATRAKASKRVATLWGASIYADDDLERNEVIALGEGGKVVRLKYNEQWNHNMRVTIETTLDGGETRRIEQTLFFNDRTEGADKMLAVLHRAVTHVETP
jgi:hypothetical protein